MNIRRAQVADAPAICQIWNPVIRDSDFTFTTVEKSTEGVAEMIEQRPAFWVAEADTRVVGFATYGPFRSGPGYARSAEHTVILAPDAQGQGLGRALIKSVENAAREEGIHALIAGISGSNGLALAFHTRLGFQTVGILPEVGFKFGRYLDLHLMQKRL